VIDSTLSKLAGAAVCLVAAIAATVSYQHIYLLAVTLGQPKLAAVLMPLSVDGAVAAASIALLSAARTGASAPGMARLMLALGVTATLAANAYSGSTRGIAGMALAMWPGIGFIGSTETALSIMRKAATTVSEPATVPDIETARTPERPPLSLAWPTRGVAVMHSAPSERTLSKAATVRRTRTASGKRTRTALVADEAAALLYAPDIAAGNVPSMRKVRADLRVGQTRAQQIVKYLKSLSTAERMAA
jgi:Protein of unknown function (DUF2637)